MRLSVCMTTYNGVKYVRQQLESILRQSRCPDEVIICDDSSTDETVAAIKIFLQENQLQNTWHLYQNKENKGYPGNFYYAMSLCSGDIVFLADQDDVWHEEKLARMCQIFEEHSETMVVSCKLSLIDMEGADIHSVMSPMRKKHKTREGGLRRIGIDDVFYKCEWPGMVMAYRQDWYQSWSCGSYNIPHDFLICARAAEERAFFQMDEILAYHRRHDNNTGREEHRMSRLLQKERKLKEVQDYLQILQDFNKEKILQTKQGKAALYRKLSTMQDRYEALESEKICRVLRNAWVHWKETRVETLLCDMIITLKS